MTAVKLDRVSKSYGSTVAVREVSLEAPEGEFVSLLGPSGCGKTTLLRMVAGLIDPDAGSVRIDGVDVSSIPPFKRDIGLVFQQGALFPHRTVVENVAFGLKMRGVAKREREKRASEMLELVQLPGLEKRRTHGLSGGQQQRVALARALAIEPKVLLLDEPFSALDRQLRVDLRRDVLELQRELGITTIAVTHDQLEALSMSDRIVVMNAGLVEQIGSPQDIYLRPETRFTAEFIGENNMLRATVAERDDRGCVMETDGGLRVQAPGADMPVGSRIWAVLRADRLALDELDSQDPEGAVKGTVYLVSFMGELTRYYIDMAGETRIFVDGAARPGEPGFAVGDEVLVRPTAAGAYCFPRDA